MSLYYDKKTRRQFLVGTGKTMLALPLLPSLLPKEAWSAAQNISPRMMLFIHDHGNLEDMWYDKSLATQEIGIDGLRAFLLSSKSNFAIENPALNHPLYNTLVSSDSISFLRGFRASGHIHGNSNVSAGTISSPGPSLDRIISRSSTLYPPGVPLSVQRSIYISTGTILSYDENGKISTDVYRKNSDSGVETFYNQVFKGLTNSDTNADQIISQQEKKFTNELKSNILNQVFESFKTFKTSRKISSIDKLTLDQHMDMISDVQKNFEGLSKDSTGQNLSSLSCTKPAAPKDIIYNANPALYTETYISLLAIAFKCGLTNFGMMNFNQHNPQWIPNINSGGKLIHQIMHGTHNAEMQLKVKINMWRYFSNVIADKFLSPLQEEEGNTGRTYLDNMITGIICGGGMMNPGTDGGHSGADNQQILIGSMGGKLISGKYYYFPKSGNKIFPYNSFLISLLHLMGVPKSDYTYATSDGKGLGIYSNQSQEFSHRFYDPIHEVLRS